MKNYPQKENKSRERKCACRECNIIFCPKNDKAIFHSPECKSREGYLRKQDEYGQELKWFKDFIHNRKVLATLYESGKYIVTDEVLDAFGFRRLVGTLFEFVKGTGLVIPYGKYLLCWHSETSYIIKKL